MPDPAEERHWAEQFFKTAGLEVSDLVIADKPDARFTWDGKCIGMEITRVDSQEYHRGQKLAHERFPTQVYSTTGLHDDHGRRRKSDELVVTMFSEEWESLPLGYQRWGQACAQAEATKTRKLNQSDFEHFDEDWLLITGIEGPGANSWDYTLAPDFLYDALAALRRDPAHVPPGPFSFHRVYFHFEPNLFLLAEQHLKRLAPIITA